MSWRPTSTPPPCGIPRCGAVRFSTSTRASWAVSKELLERTLRDQAHMIEFAAAIKDLTGMLLFEANGSSLEGLYAKVPDVLRGYVELVYDLSNRPTFRFIERLLYQSPYYDRSRQSVALSLAETDDRPFVFSTPRIEDDTRLQINIPFEHEGIDELMQMR